MSSYSQQNYLYEKFKAGLQSQMSNTSSQDMYITCLYTLFIYKQYEIQLFKLIRV